ncbi:MAG: SRPBCC family protein [Alphaproteobacteria bacterium]|nr:SRPBCC family protein [Alphaproteobacteria bacterium]
MRLGTLVAIVFLGAIILIGAVALVLRKEKIENQADVFIKAPAPIVWQYLINPGIRDEWMSDVLDAAVATGSPGEAGATLLLSVQQEAGGQVFRTQLAENIISAQGPVSMLVEIAPWRAQGEQVNDVNIFYLLSDEPEGTALSATAERRFDSFWGSLFATFASSAAQENLEGNLERLKTYIEENEPPYPYEGGT